MYFFDGFIQHNCVRSIVMDSSISDYRPVTVYECALFLLSCIGSLFNILHLSDSFFAGQCCLVDCNNGSNHAELCMACMLSGF